MEELERVLKIKEIHNLKNQEISEKTGIEREIINNVIGKRTAIKVEHLRKFYKAFPEYKHWIAFGEEKEEIGQISPMTKKAQELLKQAGKGTN